MSDPADAVVPDPSAACQSCGHHGMDIFYEVRDIPVHSVVLMPTQETARKFPRGDLRLGICPKCGFIQNTRFAAGSIDYTQRTEETQAFSGTFNAFARDLAKTLVDRHDLHGKTVLEIGGGKGEFLVHLCELGDNRGIGIDPSYLSGRLDSEALDRIEFIREFYDERHVDTDADFIVCRHTLEHIPTTGAFVRLVRQTAQRQPGTVVFLEVPDVARVLKEMAFWDLYHEHCSYFTLGSLTRLFRGAGLQPTGLSLAFDDQYLLIEAGVSEAGSGLLPGEDDLEETIELVGYFAGHYREKLEEWRRRLAQYAEAGARVAIWGAGSKGVAFLTTLGLTHEVACAVDVNPHKQGMYMPGTGHPVVGPDSLEQMPPDVVIVMNPVYLDEIRAALGAVGVAPELVAV